MRKSIYFTLEKAQREEGQNKFLPLLAVVSFQNIRIRFRMGYNISPSDWMEEGRVQSYFMTDNGVDADKVNSLISAVSSSVNNYFAQCEILHKEPLEKGIISLLCELTGRKKRLRQKKEKSPEIKEKAVKTRSFMDYVNRCVEYKHLSENRRKHYKSTFRHFMLFCEGERIVPTLDNITPEILERFKEQMQTGKLGSPKSRNTLTGILSRIKSFWRYCVKMGYTTNNPFLRFEIEPEVYGDPIYITKEERDTLYYLHIPDERLRKTRDIFVFQCLVGCRVGDLIRLKKDNVVNSAIEYIPRKTKDERPVIARIPLCPKAQSIIDRYTIQDEGKLLPFISPQKYNDYIKELFRFADITRTVTRLNPLTRQEERVSIADIASSHMARRTFIGILHRKVKNEVIGSMSGHSANSKAFSRYYNIEDDTKRDAVNTYLD